jgi:copper chaperone CopZ
MKFRMSLLLMAVVLAGAGAFFLLPSESNSELSMAELSVRNLTCSACVQNVQKALGDVPGVGKVEVNLADGQTRVAFDPERTNPEIFAARLTAAGYPAMVGATLSSAEVRQQQQEEERMAARFVARIGERFITQEEFAQELTRRTDNNGLVSLAARSAIWQELLQRYLLLGAVERAGIIVEESEIDREWARMSDLVGFSGKVEQLGGEMAFRQLLKEEMAIGRLIEVQAPAGQNRLVLLNAWYQGLVETTPVTIFDPLLKVALQGGCGSGCCSPRAS